MYSFSNFVSSPCYQVKVQTWVKNRETDEFVGVGARFGPIIESKEKHANRTILLLADPFDCCTPLKEKVTFLEKHDLAVCEILIVSYIVM